YNWNSEADNTLKHTGFIAQNLEQIFPDLVTTDEGGMKGANYIGLVPYIVRGMQEQVLILNGDKELINQNNFDSVLAEIRNEEGGEVEETFRTRVQNGFSVLFDFVAARITAIRGYFEEIFAKKITTETLKAKVVCVEKADGTEFCVNGEEVERIFGKDANIYSAENITTSDLLTASSTEVVEGGVDSSTTTAPIDDATSTVDSTASSTEDAIIPEPVADPIPEESIPENTETAPIDDAISTVDSTASSTEEILP
ncbi:MAG TPA: tail fiber domain-containing protein, partial [Candidatus Paceibacterota bacterium]|nr:tail fiber domain-containing protein [Candidatus Paceibacterota bacterium]